MILSLNICVTQPKFCFAVKGTVFSGGKISWELGGGRNNPYSYHHHVNQAKILFNVLKERHHETRAKRISASSQQINLSCLD